MKRDQTVTFTNNNESNDGQRKSYSKLIRSDLDLEL